MLEANAPRLARKAAATEVLPPALIGPVFRVAARLGLVHRYMCRQRQLHTLVTNLHRPDRRLTFAGAPAAGVLASRGMRSVIEPEDGRDGLLSLAEAWHDR